MYWFLISPNLNIAENIQICLSLRSNKLTFKLKVTKTAVISENVLLELWYELELFHAFAAHVCVFLLLTFVTRKSFRICIGLTTFHAELQHSNLIRSGISYCNSSNNFKQIPSPAVFNVQLTESYRRRARTPWCSERKHCPIKDCIQLFLLSPRKPFSSWKAIHISVLIMGRVVIPTIHW